MHYHLENLTEAEVDFIFRVLAKQPYEVVHELMAKIKADVAAQVKAAKPE